uniref:Uncharacterized protein n=1 Tax=Oryzias melastigma TaxID=30732 RepID=A0A3B3DR01_ORYME
MCLCVFMCVCVFFCAHAHVSCVYQLVCVQPCAFRYFLCFCLCSCFVYICFCMCVHTCECASVCLFCAWLSVCLSYFFICVCFCVHCVSMFMFVWAGSRVCMFVRRFLEHVCVSVYVCVVCALVCLYFFVCTFVSVFVYFVHVRMEGDCERDMKDLQRTVGGAYLSSLFDVAGCLLPSAGSRRAPEQAPVLCVCLKQACRYSQNVSICLWDTGRAASASRTRLPRCFWLRLFRFLQPEDADPTPLPVIQVARYHLPGCQTLEFTGGVELELQSSLEHHSC